MPETGTRRLRCAVYTRKSSEEGLEQEFNSLEAQRDACEAYIRSQAHEGWVLVPDAFDDGGYSGGNTDRPGLAWLMEQVNAGAVDVIVIYKIDRLTRSLTDFARLAEAFDAHKVSFVSVTQQFNTTTSMGRLMLNVLLSFAQFERELTGERIRDKIAASKRRGMWMGGLVPLGYDVYNRALVVNEAEAATVKTIFHLYLEAGNVRRLQDELARRGMRTKATTTRRNVAKGDLTFSRGHLYKLLSNPIYVGDIRHKSERHKGLHQPIIEPELWDRVQAALADNTQGERRRANTKHPSLLAGLLYDAEGNRFTSSHAIKDGKRYRYYVAKANAGSARRPLRIPAHEIEAVVLRELVGLLRDEQRLIKVLQLSTAEEVGRARTASSSLADVVATATEVAALRVLVDRVVLAEGHVELHLYRRAVVGAGEGVSVAVAPLRVVARGVETRLVIEGRATARRDEALVRAVAKALAWFEELRDGATVVDIARRLDVEPDYVARILPLAFLPPPLVEAILEGTQPPQVTLEGLVRREGVPAAWSGQAPP